MLAKEHRAVRFPLFIVCICCSIVRNKILNRLIIQLVWYTLKQLFTSVSVKVIDIYLAASQVGKYPPPFTSELANQNAEKALFTCVVYTTRICRIAIRSSHPSRDVLTSLTGRAVSSWLVRSSPERAMGSTPGRGHCVVFKTLNSHSASLHPIFVGELFEKRNKLPVNDLDGLASRPGGVEILLAASCYRNRG